MNINRNDKWIAESELDSAILFQNEQHDILSYE